MDSCAGPLCCVFLRTHQRVPAGSSPDALRGGPFLSVPLLPVWLPGFASPYSFGYTVEPKPLSRRLFWGNLN